MPNVLVADAFVNNSVDVKHDRMNTLLNETFQMTVRQQIYDVEDSNSDEYIDKIIRGTATPAKDLHFSKKKDRCEVK